MKKKTILFFLLITCFSLCAQKQDTCKITLTPGNIRAAISDSVLRKTEMLVIHGSMDARDFRWIRSTAVQLAYLDLRDVSIVAYNGSEGTENFGDGWYPPNTLPAYCFYKDSANVLLTSVLLPNTLREIEPYAFQKCTALQKMVLPASCTILGEGCFSGCKQLSEINLPSGLLRIENNLFYECTSLRPTPIPESVNLIAAFAFYHCQLFKKIVVPDSVKLIDTRAFGLCSNVDTVVLGYALSMVMDEVFYGCNNLNCMEVRADIPPYIADNTMNDTILNQTKLFLPFGSKSRYENAKGWNLFKTIQENTFGVALDNQSVRFPHRGADVVKIGIRVGSSFDKTWTVQSNHDWLKVTPATGSSNDTIRLVAEANPTSVNREALITLLAPGLAPKQVKVVQSAGPKTLALTAGTLSANLTATEKKDITDLTLTGTINKLDLDVLSTRMPILRRLDLSATEVLSYNNGVITYAANTIRTLRADSLEWVRLPKGTKVLGDFAFCYCKNLKQISLGDSLTTVNSSAFENCSSLMSIVFPASTSNYGSYCLSNCPNLHTITVLNPVPVTISGAMESTAFPRITLYVPKGALRAYQNDSRWNRFQSILELETAVDEWKSKSSLQVNPNPFREGFTIQGIGNQAEITVTDLQGIVQQRKQLSKGETISMRNSPPGMYLLHIHTETGNSLLKILKVE